MFMWRKPPPPPPPPFYKKPAVVTIILTLVAMFVLGPVGVIYNSMSEELKQKVDNKTLQLMIEKDREAIKKQELELKEKEEKDETQDAAIIENQKTLIILRQQMTAPKNLTIEREAVRDTEVEKKAIPPDFFEKYHSMSPELQTKYKKYLETKGYDTEGL